MVRHRSASRGSCVWGGGREGYDVLLLMSCIVSIVEGTAMVFRMYVSNGGDVNRMYSLGVLFHRTDSTAWDCGEVLEFTL